jgi:hypothetical protein
LPRDADPKVHCPPDICGLHRSRKRTECTPFILDDPHFSRRIPGIRPRRDFPGRSRKLPGRKRHPLREPGQRSSRFSRVIHGATIYMTMWLFTANEGVRCGSTASVRCTPKPENFSLLALLGCADELQVDKADGAFLRREIRFRSGFRRFFPPGLLNHGAPSGSAKEESPVTTWPLSVYVNL